MIHSKNFKMKNNYGIRKKNQLTELFSIVVITAITLFVSHPKIMRHTPHRTHISLKLLIFRIFTLFMDISADLLNCLRDSIIMTRFPLSFTQINDILDHEANTMWYAALLDDSVKRAEVRVQILLSWLFENQKIRFLITEKMRNY